MEENQSNQNNNSNNFNQPTERSSNYSNHFNQTPSNQQSQNNNFNQIGNQPNYNNTNYNNQNFRNANPNTTQAAYKAFQGNEKKQKSGGGAGFGKTVVLPFLCGVLGTVIVIGTCVSVPGIKDSIVRQLVSSNNSSNTSENDNNSALNLNTQLISLQDYSDTAVGVASKVQPSIVGITVEYSVNSIFYNNSATATAKGSGIIISEDGYILTNNHVVNSASSNSNSFYEIGKANKVTVKLYNDDTEYEGEIIGTDSETDLAVIKIDKDGLTAAELGDSDSIQVGEFVMAIGSPLGLDNSVTAGIVSAVNREVTDEDGNTYVAIQTDAAINSGNSGGALVNSKGQVIGVNTLKLSGDGVEGVGFAIPINSTKDIYKQLIEYNKVRRPYIGIGGRDLDERTAEANNLVVGIYIQSIEEFSAAEKAGLKIGDVIIEADGQKITTVDELNEIKNQKEIGDTMTLTIYRDGEEREVTLTLQEQP